MTLQFYQLILIVQLNILTLKYPHIHSQSTYFSKFSWEEHTPDPPNISMLRMLIVLHTATHMQSSLLYNKTSLGLYGLTTGSQLCHCKIIIQVLVAIGPAPQSQKHFYSTADLRSPKIRNTGSTEYMPSVFVKFCDKFIHR